MANQNPFFFCLLALAAGLLAATDGAKEKSRHYSKPFNRSCFPAGFIFGAGSAAYQVGGTPNAIYSMSVLTHSYYIILYYIIGVYKKQKNERGCINS